MTERLVRLDRFSDFDLSGPDNENAFEEIERTGCTAFIEANPDYYPSRWNSDLLLAWCRARTVPATRRNLEVAYRDLSADGMLGKKRAASTPTPKKIATTPVEGRLATAEPTEGEASFLQKVADDPKLNDHQRQARDEKLRHAAIASRLANSSIRPGEDPKILI